MRGGGQLFLVLGILFIVLSLSVVSASIFSDIWGKITGQPVRNVVIDSTESSAISTPSCSDSDGGMNYLVKGMVYGQDTNFTNYFFNDTCSGNSVVEYYCNQNTSSFASINYNCANLGSNYVCQNGVCVQQLNASCTSDSQCPSNSVEYCSSPTQVCSNVTSYSCISGQCVVSGGGHGCGTCSNGCSNGACIQNNQTNTSSYFDLSTTAITFSDNTPEVGQLIVTTKTVKNLGNVNGYITGGYGSTCLVGASGCSGGGGGSRNGTLILAGETKYFYENYSFYQAGTWELKRSYSGKGINNETDINLANNEKTVYINVSGNTTTVTCTDSDGGYNYNIQGTASYQGQTYNDYCVQNGTYAGWVYEYACNNGVLGTGVYNCASSGGVCSGGACVQNTTSSCIDSDNGLNYYVKGTLQNWLNATLEDYCLDGNNLIERYCTSDPNVFTQQYSCPNGCSNGACISQNQTITCSDSDGGWYPSTRGTATITSGSQSLKYTDFCIPYYNNTNNNNTLHEYSCSEDNTALAGGNIVCPYGCSDGACKSKSLPNSCPWWKFWKKCGAIAETQSAASEK